MDAFTDAITALSGASGASVAQSSATNYGDTGDAVSAAHASPVGVSGDSGNTGFTGGASSNTVAANTPSALGTAAAIGGPATSGASGASGATRAEVGISNDRGGHTRDARLNAQRVEVVPEQAQNQVVCARGRAGEQHDGDGQDQKGTAHRWRPPP